MAFENVGYHHIFLKNFGAELLNQLPGTQCVRQKAPSHDEKTLKR